MLKYPAISSWYLNVQVGSENISPLNIDIDTPVSQKELRRVYSILVVKSS